MDGLQIRKVRFVPVINPSVCRTSSGVMSIAPSASTSSKRPSCAAFSISCDAVWNGVSLIGFDSCHRNQRRMWHVNDASCAGTTH